METLKKIGKAVLNAVWNKAVVGGIIGAIATAVGVTLKPEVIETLACLLKAGGCE